MSQVDTHVQHLVVPELEGPLQPFIKNLMRIHSLLLKIKKDLEPFIKNVMWMGRLLLKINRILLVFLWGPLEKLLVCIDFYRFFIKTIGFLYFY